VLLAGNGHLSLPSDRRVVLEVARTLTRLHTDGTAGPDDEAGITGTAPATSGDEACGPPQPPGRRWRHYDRTTTGSTDPLADHHGGAAVPR
jgi:hypothetical protein